MDLATALQRAETLVRGGDLDRGIAAFDEILEALADESGLELVQGEVMRRLANVFQARGDIGKAQKARADARLVIRDVNQGDDRMKRGLESLLLSDQGRGFEALASEDEAANCWEEAYSVATAAPECADEILGFVVLNATRAAVHREDLERARSRAARALEVAHRMGNAELAELARANAEAVEGRVTVLGNAAAPPGSLLDVRLQGVLNQYRWLMNRRYFNSASTLLEGEIEVAEQVQEPSLVVEFFAQLAMQRFSWRRPLHEIRAAANMAIHRVEQLRAGSGPYAIDTAHLRDTADVAYQTLAFALLEGNVLEEAFDVLERARAQRLAKDQLEWTEAGLADKLPPELSHRLIEVRDRIRKAAMPRPKGDDHNTPRRDLAYAPATSQTDHHDSGSTKTSDMRLAQSEFTNILRAAFQAAPESFRTGALPLCSLRQVQAALKPGELLLQPAQLSQRLFVLAITAQTQQLVQVDSETPWRELVDRCAKGLAADISERTNVEPDLAALGEILLGDIGRLMADATTLLWCPPAGRLGTIPLAALQVNGRYIVELWRTVHLPVAAMVCSRASRECEGLLVALGNPDGTLPAAEKEVAAIATIYSGSVAVRGEATSDFLQKHARHGGIAHLACHGEFDKDLPGFSRLGLAPATEDGKGLLFAADISGLQLDLSLVVLSACETGLVGTAGSAEEIGGLGLAFLMHGADSVVAGLWKVGDAATKALMVRFYEHLKEHPKAEALQRASLDVMRTPHLEHPSCWAPFVLMGDWRGRVQPT